MHWANNSGVRVSSGSGVWCRGALWTCALRAGRRSPSYEGALLPWYFLDGALCPKSLPGVDDEGYAFTETGWMESEDCNGGGKCTVMGHAPKQALHPVRRASCKASSHPHCVCK